MLKRLLISCSIRKSTMNVSAREPSCIFLWDCHASVFSAGVCFVYKLLQWRLSPVLNWECGAGLQYLERSYMLTDLFCYFRDNAHAFLPNICYNRFLCWAQIDVSFKACQVRFYRGLMVREPTGSVWSSSPLWCTLSAYLFDFDVVTVVTKLSGAERVLFLTCQIMLYL